MKIFISWSGDTAKELAALLHSWIRQVIQATRPYFTPEDIAKGVQWGADLADALKESSIIISCYTRQNLKSEWMIFEAGAVSRESPETKVCALLFDQVKRADLHPSLAQFQATLFNKDDMRLLMTTINAQLPEDSVLPPDRLEDAFDNRWPQLERDVAMILREQHDTIPIPRPQQEMIEEILELMRANARRESNPFYSGEPASLNLSGRRDYFQLDWVERPDSVESVGHKHTKMPRMIRVREVPPDESS